MRIGFFGASVTEQSGDGSYIQHLQALLPYHQLLKFGFGACHFYDAGFHKLEDVLKEAPERVILEWNTTGLSAFNMLKLGSVVRRILESGALPRILVLPRRDSIGMVPRMAEVQVREFCQQYRVPMLDLTSGFEPDGLLRDMVHTTPAGAAHYAAQIARWLAASPPWPLDECLSFPKLSSAVHPVSVEISADSGLYIHVLRSAAPLEEIVAEVIVGPNMVDLVIEAGGQETLLSLVDPWCYYERRMFRTLWRGGPAVQAAELEISLRAGRIPPDYSVLDKPRLAVEAPPAVKLLSLHLAGVDLGRIQAREGGDSRPPQG